MLCGVLVVDVEGHQGGAAGGAGAGDGVGGGEGAGVSVVMTCRRVDWRSTRAVLQVAPEEEGRVGSLVARMVRRRSTMVAPLVAPETRMG